MLPIGVRIKVRSNNNLRKRSSGAASTSKKNSPSPGVKKIPRPSKKQLPPTKKFLRTSKERAAKIAKKEAKKKKQQAVEEFQYHVLSRRPAWADDQGAFYGIYGSYYHQNQQKRKEFDDYDDDDLSEATKLKMQEEQSKATEAHRRWLKKNKISDALSGKLGKNVKKPKVKRQKPRDGGAGILLYVGFGLTIVGLILTVLGAGEDGFKSPELGLIGPSLLGMGAFFAFLRLLTCTFQDKCARICPRFCPQPKPALQPVQTQPTTVAAAKSPKKTRVVTGVAPLRLTPTPPLTTNPSVTQLTTTDGVDGIVISGVEQEDVTSHLVNDKVSFENETKGGDSASVDIDLSEFEEVELNSPESSSKFKRKTFAPSKGELVLDPSQLINK